MQSASIEDGQPPDDHKHLDLQQQKHLIVLQPDYKVRYFNYHTVVGASIRASSVKHISCHVEIWCEPIFHGGYSSA